ncbi:hypothetical protein G9A89_020033 [Geosiphon pyriformis]|nr:hypothetical protein G9A89_020033 [Geosiphon pyriformis]
MPPERPNNRKRNSARQSQTQFQVTAPILTSPALIQPRDNNIPQQRKKRNPLPEQQTSSKPRQSVFERLGTKNALNGSIDRPVVAKKEKFEHGFGLDIRKQKGRVSEDTKTPRQVDLEPQGPIEFDRNIEAFKPKERGPLDNKPKKEINTNNKNNPQVSNISDGKKTIDTQESNKKDNKTETISSKELKPSSSRETNLQKEKGDIPQNSGCNEPELKEKRESTTSTKNEVQRKQPEDSLPISGVNPIDVSSKRQKHNYDDSKESVVSLDESEPTKEDVISIQADDDDSSNGGEDNELGEITDFKDDNITNESNNIAAQEPSSRRDSPKERERDRDRDQPRPKESVNTKDSSGRIRSQPSSEDGRIADKERHHDRERFVRPSGDSIGHLSVIDDRRIRGLDRDAREREREERYNRALAAERALLPIDRSMERERRERERQERYNKSILESKSLLDIPRKNERDKYNRERDRSDIEKGNSGSESVSTTTNRAGEISRSSSVSARERVPLPGERSSDRTHRDDLLKDREKDSRSREVLSRDRERDIRQREDMLKDKERELRQREELPREKERDFKLREEPFRPREKEVNTRDEPLKDRDIIRDKVRDFTQREDLFRDRERDSRLRHEQVKDSVSARIKTQEKDFISGRRSEDQGSRKSDEHSSEKALSEKSNKEIYSKDRDKVTFDSLERTQKELTKVDLSSHHRSASAESKDHANDYRSRDEQVNTEINRAEKRTREEFEANDQKETSDRDSRNEFTTNHRQFDLRNRETRSRDDYPTKEISRNVLNREKDRELIGRRDDRDRLLHDRSGALPDLYRPLSDSHPRDSERRPIRDFDRELRDREQRNDMLGPDRYRIDYPRERDQLRDRPMDTLTERYQRENERKPSWEMDREIREREYRNNNGFTEKEHSDQRRERIRDDEDVSPTNSEKTEAQRQPNDRYSRESERRVSRDVEMDIGSRVARTEINNRRSESDKNFHSVNEGERDGSKDQLDNRNITDKNIDRPKRESKILPLANDEPPLPYPWKKCLSSKNKIYYFNTLSRESRWIFPGEKSESEIPRKKPVTEILNRDTTIGPTNDIQKVDRESLKRNDTEQVSRKKSWHFEHDSREIGNLEENKELPHRDANSLSYAKDESSMSSYSPNSASKKDILTKEQRSSNDRQSESLPMRLRGNTGSSVTMKSPPPSSNKSQTSPTQLSQFSIHNRSSTSSGFNERRFSSDHDPSSGPRRPSYGTSLAPPVQLRAISTFNRSGPIDMYERNEPFRNEDFSQSSRNLSNSPNIGSTGINSSPGQQSGGNRNQRSPIFMSPSHFTYEQSNSPGSRRGLPTVNTNIRVSSSGQHNRTLTIHDNDVRGRFAMDSGEEDRMDIDDSHSRAPSRKNSDSVLSFQNHLIDSGRRKSDTNKDGKSLGRRNFQEFVKGDQVQTVLEESYLESEDDAWHSDEGNVFEDEYNDVEPSLLLFQHLAETKKFKRLTGEEQVEQQILQVWEHISPLTAGNDLYAELKKRILEHSGRVTSRYYKQPFYLNSRTEFERQRELFGGPRLLRYKHLSATPRSLPISSTADSYFQTKVNPEVPDEIFNACLDIHQGRFQENYSFSEITRNVPELVDVPMLEEFQNETESNLGEEDITEFFPEEAHQPTPILAQVYERDSHLGEVHDPESQPDVDYDPESQAY